ncbi:hypothetical protein FBZ92_14322 [Nitrospirillum viridazoti]|uniref:Uncharacterized protein n=1 Tax=Nitrospirillum amazonense TaxID=28077 RepID=A0A560HK01_9PROT|nr:hypothetical protein FBZ92_14322 [Nitrospirillum amazonense]
MSHRLDIVKTQFLGLAIYFENFIETVRLIRHLVQQVF